MFKDFPHLRRCHIFFPDCKKYFACTYDLLSTHYRSNKKFLNLQRLKYNFTPNFKTLMLRNFLVSETYMLGQGSS